MVDENNELRGERKCQKQVEGKSHAFFLIPVRCEEEGSLWPEMKLKKSTMSRMENLPDRRAEGSVVVLRHQEAKVGSAKREEGTWRGDVVVDSSE